MSKRFPPSPEEMLTIASVLEEYILIDHPLQMNYHQSLKGYSAIRISGSSRNITWIVDCYQGPWFVVVVSGFEPASATDLLSLIALLSPMLGGLHD
jgi:hypothetical protein